MKCVYILYSVAFPGRYYTGITEDLPGRMAKHNAGEVPHDAKYKPWRSKRIWRSLMRSKVLHSRNTWNLPPDVHLRKSAFKPRARAAARQAGRRNGAQGRRPHPNMCAGMSLPAAASYSRPNARDLIAAARTTIPCADRHSTGLCGPLAWLHLGAGAGSAAPCGGDFDAWLEGVKQEAAAQGISQRTIQSALAGVTYDPGIIARDHAQGVFRQSFEQFSGRMVPPRLARGAELLAAIWPAVRPDRAAIRRARVR